jgi:hypothetical protein
MGTVPRSYWVISVIALVWMLFGVMAWTMDLMMDEAALAQLPEAQRQLYTARPQWLFAVYGLAIGAGVVGAVGLLLRRAWAVAAFAVSLAAVVVQFSYTFTVMGAYRLLGPSALAFPALIVVIGAFLLWYAVRARRRGWLVT